MGRATYGVRGIRLRAGDRVVAMEALDPHGAGAHRHRAAATASARRSRTTAARAAAASASSTSRSTPKTGEVVGVRYVTPDEGLMLITQEGMIIRLNVSGVREVGRSAQGVKLMDLDAEDRIVAVAKLAEKDEETEIELAKGDGGPVPAELELEAADRAGRRTTPTSWRSSTTATRRRTARTADDDEDETVRLRPVLRPRWRPIARVTERQPGTPRTQREPRMEFFLDTAEIKEIETGLEWGMVDGVTTNPSLIAKAGQALPADGRRRSRKLVHRPGLGRGAGHRVRRDHAQRRASSPSSPRTSWSRCR